MDELLITYIYIFVILLIVFLLSYIKEKQEMKDTSLTNEIQRKYTNMRELIILLIFSCNIGYCILRIIFDLLKL